MNAADRQRREVHFAGQVQGVGFRYTTRTLAARFQVAGWVKNLPDGRVKMVVEGEPEELDRFQEAILEAMAGNVQDWESTTSEAQGEFAGFEIRH